MNRRDLMKLFAAATVASSCASESAERFSARLRSGGSGGTVGLVKLQLDTPRDGFLYVPRAGTLPLMVLLHGAGGNAPRLIDRWRDFADEFGFIMLVPESRGPTWDVVRSRFGPDIEFINRALDRVFTQYAVDPNHLAIGGFSDGASYALSVGLANGDLFTHVLGFSPGFIVPVTAHGRPRIFISHGTEDEILPIDSTSRRIVPGLRELGYRVEYVEFRGPHTLPRDIARRAFEWFLGERPSRPPSTGVPPVD